MARCSRCTRIMVGGYKSGEERFCSLSCYTSSPTGTFCGACMAATTNDTPGGTFTFNSVGTRLCFVRNRCPECHSIVQRKFFVALYIPLIPMGSYRVIYTAPRRYLGRRLRRGAVPAAVPEPRATPQASQQYAALEPK